MNNTLRRGRETVSAIFLFTAQERVTELGRKAKCRTCGKDLDTTTAFKLIAHDTNGKPKTSYYCSREEYEADEEKKRKAAADKDRAYKLICQIIDREKIINTALWREWKEWNTVADDEVIAQYLDENQDYLVGAISRLEDKEFNRIRYLSAILKNSLGDYKPKAIIPKVTPNIQDEHYETKFKLKPRRGFDDFEEDCNE